MRFELKLDVKKVKEAQTIIRGVADNTPLIPSFFLSSIIGQTSNGSQHLDHYYSQLEAIECKQLLNPLVTL